MKRNREGRLWQQLRVATLATAIGLGSWSGVMAQETAIKITHQTKAVLPGRVSNVAMIDGQLYCYASGVLLVAQRNGGEVVGFWADTLFSRLRDGVNYVVKQPITGDVYFTCMDKKGLQWLYCSRNVNGKLKKAKRVKLNGWMVEHPVFTSDGQTMIFSARGGTGSQGGNDLWCMKSENGKWGEPQNFGKRINTSYDELTPTVWGNYLFFASTGREDDRGKLNLYAIRLSENSGEGNVAEALVGNSPVQQLPVPVNSTSDDFDLVMDTASNCGYWVSRRMAEESDSQLFSFKGDLDGVMLWGNVADVYDNIMSGVRVVVKQNGIALCSTQTDDEGRYQLYLPGGQYYDVQFQKEGYFVEYEVVNTAKKDGDLLITEERRDAAMSSLVHGAPIYYDDLFGAGADIELSDFGRERLAPLVRYLTDNPRSRVKLTLVSDLTNDAGFNLMLTSGRLQTVESYLYAHVPTTVAMDFSNGCAGNKGCNTATERVRLTVVIE